MFSYPPKSTTTHHTLPISLTAHYTHCTPACSPTCIARLVALLDEVVRQVLDGRCAVAGYHGFVVVCDEDGLLGLHNHEALALLGTESAPLSRKRAGQ